MTRSGNAEVTYLDRIIVGSSCLLDDNLQAPVLNVLIRETNMPQPSSPAESLARGVLIPHVAIELNLFHLSGVRPRNDRVRHNGRHLVGDLLRLGPTMMESDSPDGQLNHRGSIKFLVLGNRT